MQHNQRERINLTRGGLVMRILIYGAGVIGSIFAGKLALSTHEVTVLARGNRFQEIKDKGIVLVNPSNAKEEKAQVKVIDTLLPEDVYDYIFVVMKRTQVDEILPVLAQNKSEAIVFVVNTAAGYREWIEAIGADRLLFGFPSAGGERRDGKVYYFIGRGLQRVFQTTTFGECKGQKTERVKALVNLFNQAQIPATYCSDMDAWQKTHVGLVTNIANAIYGFECNNYALGKSYASVKEMVIGIKESREVLKAIGISPTPKKLGWFNLPTCILTVIFSLFMRSILAETTMAKHCVVAKDEMRVLQKEFDVLIQSSTVKTPAIDRLRKNLY
ncbi:MAG: ketopantoate reductase family protein [Cellulosilyticaceae bacterium]